jgi:hypothetical protein
MADTEALVKKADVQAIAIKADIAQMIADARALDIVDEVSYGKASDITKILKAKKAWLDEDRKPLTKPLDDAKAAIMARYKPQIEEIDILLKQLDTKSAQYARAVEAKRRAEEARRRAEELALLEAQKKDMLETAVEMGDENLVAAAEEIEAQETFVKAQPVEIVKAKAAGTMSSMQMKDNWRFEVVNESLVPAELKSTDKDKVKDRIKSAVEKNPLLKGTETFTGADAIPGVRIYNEPSSVSR